MSNAEKIRDGLTLLLSRGEVDVCSAHDQFMAIGPELNEDDSKSMENLGWFRDESGGWSHWT